MSKVKNSINLNEAAGIALSIRDRYSNLEKEIAKQWSRGDADAASRK